ncbi:MAG: hypothetical protein OEN21_04500 [Myxococcales bacterium]|nr:hypothetical protein [Myxococcales bacterium]
MSKTRDDGWKLHEAEQRLAWQKLTPTQRLEWIEEAKRFAEVAKHARKLSNAGVPASARARSVARQPRTASQNGALIAVWSGK